MSHLTYNDSTQAYAAKLFKKLRRHWHGDKNGMSRGGYSSQESKAMADVAMLRPKGMEAYDDYAGNRFFIYPGMDRHRPAILFGSHLDAVPKGGQFDGPAGVISALCAVNMIAQSGIRPPQDIVVAAWRCEESPAFSKASVGVQLATGNLKSAFLDSARHKSGKTLAQVMDDGGLNVDMLRHRLDAGLPVFPVDAIAAAVETHIEQGPVLELAGLSTGIVTNLYGNVRFPHKITFHGKAAHTGAEPQHTRISASRIGARFMVRVEDALDKMIEKHHDIVHEAPIASTGPDASSTTVPVEFYVQMEVRGSDMGSLIKARELIVQIAKDTAEQEGAGLTMDESKIVMTTPVAMNGEVMETLYNIGKDQGVQSRMLPSGAGHDVGYLAQAGVPTGMIFIGHGRGGVSHNPLEIMGMTPDENPVAVGSAFARATEMNAAFAMREAPLRLNANHGFIDALQNGCPMRPVI